jgi:methylglutaconyl-CoA hydratase
VHIVVSAADMESACQRKLKSLSSSGPEAVRAAKALIEQVTGLSPDEAMSITVRAISERRASDEAKEGLSAFLEKRPAKWTTGT